MGYKVPDPRCTLPSIKNIKGQCARRAQVSHYFRKGKGHRCGDDGGGGIPMIHIWNKQSL